jgi:hypothetical protein
MSAAETITDVMPTWPAEARIARATYLPHRLRELVTALAADPSVRGVACFEQGLATELGVSDALCVWMDWPRRFAWTIAGPVSPRMQDLVPEALGRGRRVVLANAIVQPVGPAPARCALVIKGAPAQVLAPMTVRMVERIATQISGSLDAVAGLHPLMR